MAVDAVDARRAVGAGDNDLVEGRMAVEGGEPTAQGTGGDRGDVVDEALRREFRELRRHIAADGDDMIPLWREDGVESPVFMGPLVEHLLAAGDVDGADGVVGAAEGDQLAIGRPGAAEDGIEGDGVGAKKRPISHVPDLDFPHPTGIAAGDRQLAAVGGEADALDPLGEADEAPQWCGGNLGPGHVEQEHLMEARHGEEPAIGGEIERGDHRLARVDGRMIGIDALRSGRRRVVLGAFTDPAAHQRHLGGRERLPLLRHLGDAIGTGRDQLEQPALLRLGGNDPRHPGIARGEHPRDIGHHERPVGLGRLMAALARGLEERANLLVVADRPGGRGLSGGSHTPLEEDEEPGQSGPEEATERADRTARHDHDDSQTREGGGAERQTASSPTLPIILHNRPVHPASPGSSSTTTSSSSVPSTSFRRRR